MINSVENLNKLQDKIMSCTRLLKLMNTDKNLDNDQVREVLTQILSDARKVEEKLIPAVYFPHPDWK